MYCEIYNYSSFGLVVDSFEVEGTSLLTKPKEKHK